ncbi:MAG: ABC transporter ATP-binding protein [Gammaproteobacteria bacterium]|nr:ABC transporter ATP-binding protein [Gammaproteobacteria bacterium]MYK82053.1 ABC transporter ATP-binding protein [Gammaproteobacteria bacterium]
MSEPALRATGLHKSFKQGSERIEVLRGLSLEVRPGERCAIVGRSGSGKSTLLHVLAGLDDLDAGQVHLCGTAISAASVGERARLRNRHVGFVYQLHHLLPEFSALENVLMPLRLGGISRREGEIQAAAMLDAVGLKSRMAHRPSALSGGERQRVAVARALVGHPEVLLADEPTGNLDRENARQVFDLMRRLSEEFGVALVVVTHDEEGTTGMDRALRLYGGFLEALA